MSLRSSSIFITFLVLVVFFINYFFLQDFFGFGLTNEDIPYLRDYKSWYQITDSSYLIKVYKTWIHAGPNWAHQILYVGAVDDLFPYNWELTQKLNFIWKSLAALSLFPFLWILTKRKLIAILATLMYSILPSANGSLTINCTGTEYLGVIFLNLFIFSYYYLIKNQKSIKLLTLSFILLYISIFAAPVRMIPILVLLGLTEIILVISGISKFKTTFFRIIIYLAPFYLMFRLIDPGTLSRGSLYDNLLKDLLAGNWQLLITPLAGLGFMLMSTKDILFFGGNPNLDSLGSYFSHYLTHGFIPLLLIITFCLAFVISQKPKRFFISIFIMNTIFQILIYIFDTHYLYIPSQQALPYNGGLEFATIPAILGSYIISIALMAGFEWYKTGKKDKVLFLTFITPLLSFSLISATWLAIGKNYGYEGPVQRYLTVPTVGMGIFISSILFLTYRKFQISKRWGIIYGLALGIFIIYLISFSYKENQYFKIHRSWGEDMAAQKHIQEQFIKAIPVKGEDILVYYEPNLVTEEDRYWFTAINYGRMSLWLFLHNYYEKSDRKVNGCIDWVNGGYKELKRFYNYSNNQAAFKMISAFCYKNSIQGLDNNHTFNQDDFFAFTLKGDQVVDITIEVLERLKNVDNSPNPL